MIEEREVYGLDLPLVLTIDRSRKFEEMFAAADRHKGKGRIPVDDAITDKYNLHRRSKVETVELHGFFNERRMATTTVLTELDTFGFVPASIIHWLAFAALCPNTLDEDPKVLAEFLGGRYLSHRLTQTIAAGNASESTLESPYICYTEFRGLYSKELIGRWIHDFSHFKVHRHVFLAVAKEGQG